MRKFLICLLVVLVLLGCTKVQDLIEIERDVSVENGGEAIPTAFSAESSVDNISLSWENESNDNFHGIQIRRSKTISPQNTFEGTLVYLNIGNSYLDSNVSVNVTYNYSIFYKDDSDIWILKDTLAIKTLTYKEGMTKLIKDISEYSKNRKSSFLIIPKEGLGLLTLDGTVNGSLVTDYVNAIDGVLKESVYYEPDNDPVSDSTTMEAFLNKAESQNKQAMVLDYCNEYAEIEDSYNSSGANGYISFQRPETMALNIFPPTRHYPTGYFTSENVTALSQATNFVYVPELNGNYIGRISTSNFDVIIINIFQSDPSDSDDQLSPSQITSLKIKDAGGSSLVLAYLDLGYAHDNYYYWESAWNASKLAWIGDETAPSSGIYNINYWNSSWQEIIFSGSSSYLKYIIDRGYDGVILDNTNVYENF